MYRAPDDLTQLSCAPVARPPASQDCAPAERITRHQPGGGAGVSRRYFVCRWVWSMMVYGTAGSTLTERDRAVLTSWTRSSTVRAGLAVRAQIVLAVAEGLGTMAAADRLG